MGNILGSDGVSQSDINEIRLITQTAAYGGDDPIWKNVFNIKGYLQFISKSYLMSITSSWSHDMKINSMETHNFEEFIRQMSVVVTEVPRRLIKNVSSDEYLDAVQRATNALFLTRCFLNTFMKECSDEELLCIFNVPKVSEIIVTPTNFNRSTLIQTYGETAFILIETVVDVIVSHSPQMQTNKMYMEAMGILLTLFSRLLRNEDIDHVISPVSPYFSPYFLLDLLYLCSGMPLLPTINNTNKSLTRRASREDTPSWAAAIVVSQLKRMGEKEVSLCDDDLYATKINDSILLYPFQLFSMLTGGSDDFIHVTSTSASRCELLLSLLVSMNCATENPFSVTLSNMINSRYSDIQNDSDNGLCAISFDMIYDVICDGIEEPPVCILFYHMVHKVPSFLEYITAKSEYVFLPRLLKMFDKTAVISDQQLYLIITIILSFSQNISFVNLLFSQSIINSKYSFILKQEKDLRNVGCLLIVLMVNIIYSHIHVVNDFYLLSGAMAVICNMFQQATNLDEFTSRKLVELLIYLSRRYHLLNDRLEKIPDDLVINITSELFSFYLDSMASFLTSDRPSHNVLFIYELLRQYNAVKKIGSHPEFDHISNSIMMVLDYLNNALEVNSEELMEKEYQEYDVILNKLSNEIKSWTFMLNKGKAKYEFEDCDSAVFFLSFSWDLLLKYCSDLNF